MSIPETQITSKIPNTLRNVLITAVFISFLEIFYSIFVHRPLIHEGSWVIYNVINSSKVWFDPQLHRYSDTIFQIPAVLLLSYFPFNFGFILRTIEICYGTHPILSLICTYYILVNRGKLELFIFPLLAWAFSTLSTNAFALGVVPGALSFFWPLFFLVLFRKENSLLDLLGIFILELLLAFSHETVVVFYPALFLATLWRYFYLKKKNFSELIVMGFHLLGAACIFTRIFMIWYEFVYHGFRAAGPYADGGFINSLLFRLDDFRIYSYLTTGLLLLGFLLPTFFKKIPANSSKLLIAMFSAVFYFFLFERNAFYSLDSVMWSKAARMSAVPMAAIIAIVTVIFSRWRGKDTFFYSVYGYSLGFLVAVSILISTVFNFGVTKIWQKHVTFLEEQIRIPGCKYIWEPQSDMNKFATIRESTSILLQNTFMPDSIVFFGVGFRCKHPLNICLEGFTGLAFQSACENLNFPLHGGSISYENLLPYLGPPNKK